MAFKKGLKRGFTLVELMIVVAIIGILAALAIYGVRRYVFTSKTAEAKTALGRMAKDAANAFNDDKMQEDVVSLGNTAKESNRLCFAATNSVPTFVPQGEKYQSKPSEWQDGDKDTGWACLGFSMQDAQYYQYGYGTTSNTTADGGAFSAIAHGDLDGDKTASTFVLKGAIQEDSAGGLVVTVAPDHGETDPLE